MTIATHLAELERELDAFYSTYPVEVSALFEEMDEISAAHPGWGPCRRKALIYETGAERCEAHVFRHCPFYYELAGGRDRREWGFGGIGSWLLGQPRQQGLAAGPAAWARTRQEHGLSHGPPVLDLDHHCVGYDNVLRLGLNGITAAARERLATAREPSEQDFLEAVIIGNENLIRIAERFGDRAREMAASESDCVVRTGLRRIATVAAHVPAAAPRTFYEALNTVLFMRELTGSLEGIGVSVLGHLDRMLGPYLERDLAAGRTTREEASDLLATFLAITDVKFSIRREPRETSTTVVIGGCDREGAPVFNDVTRMIIAGYRDLRLVNPKLNARVSSRHPPEYFQCLGELQAAGTNVLAVFNDDVVIAANVRTGKAVEDCRLYVGGGCQENMLQNTEINSRASIYLNLLHVFLMGFRPDEWQWYSGHAGISLESYEEAGSFEAFLQCLLRNLRAVADAHIDERNATEAEGGWWNPCPLTSSPLDDCIANARDMMAGGTRYAGASVSLIGVGTLTDSLLAVRHAIYENRLLPLRQLWEVLAGDFEGEEALRHYLISRAPKVGRDAEAEPFAARVFADLARVTSGRPNTRGGRYEASLFVYRAFVGMGRKTGATPDGRRAGEDLSQGMGPSRLALDGGADLGRVFDAVATIDLTAYPVVAMLDAKLP